MRLIGRSKLSHHAPEVMKWLQSWTAEVMGAQWRSPNDVIQQFPKVSYQGQGNFLFAVAGGILFLKLIVAFPQGVAFICDLDEMK
ncbi:hypothetical protein NNRS527_00108 [Nitrosospira sp. NRS527]|nr:hypothetical protein NNRS527_00108 [Nitrosospira sp. NRS527]